MKPTTDDRRPTTDRERGRGGEGENAKRKGVLHTPQLHTPQSPSSILHPPSSILRRLRIAHVTATFPPYRGGTGNVCFHNAHELARRDHEVHVFTAAVAGTSHEEILAGVNVHRLRPLVRVGNAPVLPGLAPALRGFDVIHLHYPFFGGELTALAARLRRTPLVITYHQDVFLSGAMGLVEQALRRTIGWMALRSAARLLFTSLDYGRASYIRPLLRGHERRIDELPNGVDLDSFTPGVAAPELRARHCLAPGERVALLVAGLDRAHYFKGVGAFLAALAQLPAHVRGVIVGDGDLRPAYAAAAQELGLGERVAFAGRVSDRELPDYYRLADVAVLPSVTMGEAFGLVLVEALACATPVVASDLPGVRTVVDPGVDGLLVPPGDSDALAAALTRVLGDERERCAMGRRGRAKVAARYGWPHIGARLDAIYQNVTAGIEN
jgi:glycosyltransferase involved in cell wall biosynthesis